jgi:hypothetical protein
MQFRPHRYQTQFPITLRTSTGPQRCHVTDVNTSGARIKGLRDMRRGDKLQVEILNLRADAVVQWASNGTVGITFRPQITDDQVDILRYRRDGRVSGRHRTVGYAEMR